MLGFILFKKAFSWTKDGLKDLPLVDESGEKVRVREKRLEDIENELISKFALPPRYNIVKFGSTKVKNNLCLY